MTVSDSAHKVNDGDYHVVSFIRAGIAGLLRIDSQLAQSLETPGANVSHQTDFHIYSRYENHRYRC